MKLKSLLIRFIYGGEVLEKTSSPVNGEIMVMEDLFGNKEMKIGKVTQSGGLVKKLWKVALQATSCKLQALNNCLILGLGCGDAARIMVKKWPGVQIAGIEIDPKVIEIGKKYFNLDKMPNLEIIIGDAVKKVFNTKFDLILVDLYLGTEFPKEAESDEFLNDLKNVLSDRGLIIFNRLYFNNKNKKEADLFLEKIKVFFQKVKTKKAITNLLIFASN